MGTVLDRIFHKFGFTPDESTSFKKSIKNITGIQPANIALYKLATQHRSVAPQNEKGVRESNERLEYLGDAVLGMAVAEYLFKKFPLENEGFLTEIRSRLVNRDMLNNVARKMGIPDIVEFSVNRKNKLSYKSIHGDTLEALIGAIYLDKGYRVTKKFVRRKLIKQHFDLQEVIKTDPNHKSKIIEWAHRNNKEISFEISEVRGNSHNREFMAQLLVEGKAVAKGMGFSKKKAEQDAAQKSCEKLNIE